MSSVRSRRTVHASWVGGWTENGVTEGTPWRVWANTNGSTCHLARTWSKCPIQIRLWKRNMQTRAATDRELEDESDQDSQKIFFYLQKKKHIRAELRAVGAAGGVIS